MKENRVFLIRLKSNDISTIAIIHFESPFLIFLTWQNVLNECKSNRIGIKVFWTKNFLGKANVVRGLLTILLQISKIFCPSKTFLWFFNLINFFKTCFFLKNDDTTIPWYLGFVISLDRCKGFEIENDLTIKLYV